jgi:ketosteroid isomerase-like protein
MAGALSQCERKKPWRKVYQSIKPGDFQLFLNLLAEDVQWQLPEMENVSFAGTWHGREQLGKCRPIVLTHPAAASSVRRGQPNLLVPAGRTHSKKAIA